jgi:Flp pilus assembly protein TadD
MTRGEVMMDGRAYRNWLIATLFLFAGIAGVCQSPSNNSIDGRIVDSANAPVAGARVRLEPLQQQAAQMTRSAHDGSFSFERPAAGTYKVIADKEGANSAAVEVTIAEQGTTKPITVVLASKSSAAGAANSSTMEFADTPNFTIAGVTDWTAAGGHGSDVSLRTSEALNRETLDLKPTGGQPVAGSSGTADREMESELRKELAKTPSDHEANRELGRLYLREGRFTEALPLLRKAYELKPSNAANESDFALALSKTGDHVEAKRHIGNALAHFDSADAHRIAGMIAEGVGDPLHAVHEFAVAVQRDPSEQNYFAWGEELLQHRAVLQAKDVFEEGVKRYPKSSRLLTSLGAALFAGALYQQSADRLCEASDLNASDPEPYQFMGKIEVVAQHFDSCMDTRLARYAEMHPTDALANYFYAMDLWRQQGPVPDAATRQRVESLLTKAVTLDAKCSDGFLQLGNLKSSERNYPAAIEFYAKSIIADPQSSEAHYRLGVAYDRVGEREKAKAEFAAHDAINNQQAEETERQRKQIKQFVVEADKTPVQ